MEEQWNSRERKLNQGPWIPITAITDYGPPDSWYIRGLYVVNASTLVAQLGQSNIKAQLKHAAKPCCSGLHGVIWVMEKCQESVRESVGR